VLDRKVLRDVWNLRGQVATIVLVIAAGVAVLVGSASAYFSLHFTEADYYSQSHFADIWSEATRAPKSLVGRLRQIPGVAAMDVRIVKDVRIDWPQSDLAVSGRIVSLPGAGQPNLNRISIAQGRWIDPTKSDEIIINTGFAEQWAVHPGDRIAVILNGRRQTFKVVGIAHSPEYVFAAKPGIPLPDDRAFVVLWADEAAIARAFDMEGAFNSVAVSLAPGAQPDSVIDAIDGLLGDFGSLGAYTREDQPSHRFMSDELAEQETVAVVVPILFFAIASFLLNIVLGRLVDSQREQVAALKALGYPRLPIASHYGKLVVAISTIGAALGIGIGVWYGHGLLQSYRPFLRFPELIYVLPLWLPAAATVATFAAALAGVLNALRRVLRLTPAAAMHPAAPMSLGRSPLARWMARWRLRPTRKIVIRTMAGRPLRTCLIVVGIASAVPLVVLGLFWWDALHYMIDVQFDRTERSDAVVTFTDPLRSRAVSELLHVSGVLQAEGQRVVAVRLRLANRSYRLGLTGLPTDSQLSVPRTAALDPVAPPQGGLMLSRRLADKLGAELGSEIVVEALEGARRTWSMPLVALLDDVLGLRAYTQVATLNRLMREDDLISVAVLKVDPAQAGAAWRRISQSPHVVAISSKETLLRIFDEKIAGLIVISAIVLTGFGLIIAVGIIYNTARIALQERGWEMASLRILGFRRNEVALILFSELLVEILVAVPLGLAFAQGLVELLLTIRANESFQIPAVISRATFAYAVLAVLAAGLLSIWAVRQRINRLDLLAALKTRD
jgi:putative ABC transport system permease protein